MTVTVNAPALRRISMASYIGSAIEFYDFFIYGTAAALVFPTVFFPNLGHVMATTAALGAFAAAFLARPLGAAVFGHYGDRIGRKQTLVVTLLLMGIATVGVGLIPSTAAIGVAAPLLLITLRLIQGFAVGGEWAGAVLLSAENAPVHRRGYYGMFTQLGLGTAVIMGNLVFLLVHMGFGTDNPAFLQWGWRIPFLLSAVLIATALYVRLRVDESPALDDTPHEKTPPVAALLRRQGRQLLLASGVAACAPMLVFQASTFVTHYATEHLGFSTNFVLLVGVIGGLVEVGCVVAAAMLSDSHGRRRVAAVGFGLAVPWSLVLFPLVQTGSRPVFAVAIVVTYALIGICMGPLAAFLPEIFAPQYRYTGAALAHTFGAVLGGALPPVVSPTLLNSYGGWAVAAMMGALAAVSLLCVVRLPETAGTRI